MTLKLELVFEWNVIPNFVKRMNDFVGPYTFSPPWAALERAVLPKVEEHWLSLERTRLLFGLCGHLRSLPTRTICETIWQCRGCWRDMTSTRLCYKTMKTKLLSDGKPREHPGEIHVLKQKRSDGFALHCCPLKGAYPLGMFLRCPNMVWRFFSYLGPLAPLKCVRWLCCAGPWMLWERTQASRECDCLLQLLLDNIPWAGVSRTGPQRQTHSIQELCRALSVSLPLLQVPVKGRCSASLIHSFSRGERHQLAPSRNLFQAGYLFRLDFNKCCFSVCGEGVAWR